MADETLGTHGTLHLARGAKIHAALAFAASMFGFAASWLYLQKTDPWSFKMAFHMAGWHLLLVLTLSPISLLGGRRGVRGVQVVAAVFFAIHVGIALANTDASSLAGIGILNAASGLFFLATAIYTPPPIASGK